MTNQPPSPHHNHGHGHGDGPGPPEGEARQKVIAGRLSLARHFPYYSAALFSCPISFTDEVDGFAIDSEWRIFVNPATAASLSVEEVAGSLAHEVNHALRSHIDRGRRAGVPPEMQILWNVAADCEINDDLRYDGLTQRPGVIFPEDFDLPPDKLAETYYRLLLENAESIELPALCCTSASRGPHSAHPQPGLSAARRQHLRRATAQAVIDYENKYGWGSAPGGLARWAENTAAPAADWRRILAAELRKGLKRQPGSGDWTHTRPARRPDTGSVIRPGTNQPTAHIAVVIDTSASMSEQELQQAVAETEAILKQAANGQPITVYSHDTQAHTAQQVLSAKRIQLAGGGGTDMAAAINTAAAARPKPAVIIVITDGHTPWPTTRPPNNNATAIAVLTEPDTAEHVPQWITTITTATP